MFRPRVSLTQNLGLLTPFALALACSAGRPERPAVATSAPAPSEHAVVAKAPVPEGAPEGTKTPNACDKIPECVGCKAGDGAACELLAKKFVLGDGVRQSAGFAAKLHGKACDLGQLDGCEAAGFWLLDQGVLTGEPSDRAAARLKGPEYLEKACEGDRLSACQRAGQAHAEAGNYGRALRLLTKACNGETPIAEACSQLSVFYIRGWGGAPRDLERATQLAKAGCAGGSQLGCENVEAIEEGGRLAEKQRGETPSSGPEHASQPSGGQSGSRCQASETSCGSPSSWTCCASYQTCCTLPGRNPFCGSGPHPCR